MPSKPDMRWDYLLVLLVILLISFFPSLARFPSSRFLTLYTILMRNVALLSCFFLSYRIYALHRKDEFRTIALFLSFAFGSWIFSGFSWLYYFASSGTIPQLSLADLFFFVGYVFFFLVFVSALLLYKRFITKVDIGRAGGLWLLLFFPLATLGARQILAEGQRLSLIIIFLYPLLDSLVIFLFLVLLFMYRKIKIEFFLVVLAAGIFASCLGDVLLLVYHVRGIYFVGSFPDNAFLFSLLFIAFGFSVILESRFVYFLSPPLPEKTKPLSVDLPLQEARTYLFEEREPKGSIDAFHALITHGVAGLAIVRTNPSKMREMLDLQQTPVMWLSSLEKDDAVSPADLGKLVFIISEFIRKRHDSVIFLEGVEYLVIQNDFLSVLKMIHSIHNLVSLTGSRFILTVDPNALSARERALLERGLLVR